MLHDIISRVTVAEEGKPPYIISNVPQVMYTLRENVKRAVCPHCKKLAAPSEKLTVIHYWSGNEYTRCVVRRCHKCGGAFFLPIASSSVPVNY